MSNTINGMIINLIAETANETRDIAGLEPLLVLLDKIGGPPSGLSTQKDQIDNLKALISDKILRIKSSVGV